MGQPENPIPKSPTSHLHVINLVVALLAGVISITGGIYSLKNNVFSGPAYGSLQGIVRDERIAKPLVLTSVEISDLSGAVVNTATTDDRGHYLIEAIKTGNYVVKFTAPLHKIETKTIKIEKDLASSINVDLVPEVQQANLSPVESAASVRQNIPGPYVSSGAQTAVPAAPSYDTPQNALSVPVASPGYSQGAQTPDLVTSAPQNSGFRRHSRYNYPGGSGGSSSGTSQSSSLTQVGTQLLQALISKKSENSSSTSSN
jgi:hypothetical protein